MADDDRDLEDEWTGEQTVDETEDQAVDGTRDRSLDQHRGAADDASEHWIDPTRSKVRDRTDNQEFDPILGSDDVDDRELMSPPDPENPTTIQGDPAGTGSGLPMGDRPPEDDEDRRPVENPPEEQLDEMADGDEDDRPSRYRQQDA